MPPPSPARRRAWSVLDVMAATAAAAVLMAGYRLEVGGSRGAGLVPACAFLVSCLWLRDARTARKAAGVPLGFVEVFILAPMAGFLIVATADVAFIMLAEATSLALAIRMIPVSWRHGRTVDVVLATSWAGIAGILAIGAALLVAGTWRRIFWKIALSPTAQPPAVEEATTAGDVIQEPGPPPTPPAGPSG